MLKEALSSIEGVGVYPIVSLLLFVVSFGIVLVLALRMNRGEVEYISRLPLEDKLSADSHVAGVVDTNKNTGE